MILALVIQHMNHDTCSISLLAASAVFGPSLMGLVLWTLRDMQTATRWQSEDNNDFNTPMGQLKVVAPLFDNVLALIVLSQLQSLGDLFSHNHLYHRDRDDIWNLILAMISSRIYIWFGCALAMWYVPCMLHTLLYRLPPALAGEGLGVSPGNVLLKPQIHSHSWIASPICNDVFLDASHGIHVNIILNGLLVGSPILLWQFGMVQHHDHIQPTSSSFQQSLSACPPQQQSRRSSLRSAYGIV